MTKRVSITLILLLMIISLSSCSRLERHPAISKIFSLHDITQGEKDDFIKIYGKNISGQTFKSIIEDWLKAREASDGSGSYIVDPMAIKEAQSIVTAALKEEGQTELPL